MQGTATYSSHLVLPTLFLCFSMPPTSKTITRTRSGRALRHREYYIEEADLIIRVRIFAIERRVVY
jgi:hypothetical protein